MQEQTSDANEIQIIMDYLGLGNQPQSSSDQTQLDFVRVEDPYTNNFDDTMTEIIIPNQ